MTQKLKSGEMQVLEVPVPTLKTGTVPVQNHYCVICARTETSMVQAARKGYIGKAVKRPQQFKQVIQSIRENGLVQTYRALMQKPTAYSI